MSTDSSLLVSLVQRFASRLPHRTGSYDVEHDTVAILTRKTLLDISEFHLSRVVEPLLQLLEELAKPYHLINTHPTHVVRSELHVLYLLADCCSAHWKSLGSTNHTSGNGTLNAGAANLPARNGFVGDEPSVECEVRTSFPPPLDDVLVGRIMEAARLFLAPLPEDYVIPPSQLLDDGFSIPSVLRSKPSSDNVGFGIGVIGVRDTIKLLHDKSEEIERSTRTLVEYISASNWDYVLDFLRNELRGLQMVQTPQGISAQYAIVTDEEKAFLVSLRSISSLWVDARKLGLVIQELCGSFLHFRKTFQHTIAIVLPLLITRWIEQNPGEFVDIHISRRRLDGGADTLFDMTNTMTDHGLLKLVLFPCQIALLFLLPDVWDVASGMREGKSTSITKKVAYLEGLRKGVRNRSAAAAYCLVSVLRVARHFDLDSDSALLSYALDVQDEVREALFRRSAPGLDSSIFDSELLSAGLVSIAHLDLETSKETFPSLCLAASAPRDFKIAYVSACCYLARLPTASNYDSMFFPLSLFSRTQLQQVTTDEIPDHARESSEELRFIDLICHVLKFLNIRPSTFFEDSPEIREDVLESYALAEAFFEAGFRSVVACLASDNERVRTLASTFAKKVLANIPLDASAGTITAHESFPNRLWKATSVVILTVVDKIMTSPGEQLTMLSFIEEYLAIRLKLLKSVGPEQRRSWVDQDIPERVAAHNQLETAFLILLCSADIEICQQTTACIAVFCEEQQFVDLVFETKKFVTKNLDVYVELSSKTFVWYGLVAFQKHARTILKKIKHPTPGILSSWEIAFDRWIEVSRQMTKSRPNDAHSERSITEWRNFSGFLASLGGLCISEQASVVDEVSLVGLKWIDRPSEGNYDTTLLDQYLIHSVQLLACAHGRIREATREVLSTELAPLLHLHLFRALEVELENIFDKHQDPSSRGHETPLIFAEQAAALLRAIVEKLNSPDCGSALPVDIGTLTLNFAKFIDLAPESGHVLRIKIKICQLCEIVSRKKELLNMRHDIRIRNQLLDVLFRWIARPGSSVDSSSSMHQDETSRLQRELDRATLKAFAEITHRLPLQPPEGQSDATSSDTKTLLFRTYFNRFLSLLSSEERMESQSVNRDGSFHDLSIVALSNLLSANIDIGLKHCLGIGYHEDSIIRIAFVKVLCNVLGQGVAGFNNLSDEAMTAKYDLLLEVLLNDMSMTIAICDACPSSEVDELTVSLLNIYSSRGLGFDLLQALIEHEVEQTENEAELLRRNCVTTKMLSIYAKWKGFAYLKGTLQKVLERLIVTAKDLDLELDPSRTTSSEELQRNALQLRVVTKVFIDDICNSASQIPTSFRRICNIISTSVMTRFPDAKFTAVGAFIFLRFFCPAIVAPDSEGLISVQPTKEMRRGLLLIAKVVQNLANNVLFGAKESYMFPLNDFLTQNIYRVTAFLREISAPPPNVDSEVNMEAFDFGSSVAVHRFLYDHWDQIRQKLAAQERKALMYSPVEAAHSTASVSDTLRTLINNLGQPPVEISWNRPLISANSPPAYSRFQHFMLRNSGRGNESMISTKAVYDGGESKDGLSIICVILRNIDNEAMDYDLLLYCYLKIASRMWHKPFGILVDATCYNGQNEPQDALFKTLDLLTPSELFRSLTRVYVYNMNSAFRKCFRRILRLSAKSENSSFHPSNVDYHLIGSLPDLQFHFHLGQLNLPKETISMVTDTRFVFQPITRLSKTKGKIEVVIMVGSQFVQITTTKKQEIVPGLRLHATVNDIFRLTEVDEAPTSIQTEDDSAFGLRTDSGKIVMYFTSPKKADILLAVRSAKTKYGKDQKLFANFERLIRPQDVPGTLLNIALTNLASTDVTLRLSSYNLLCALCQAFKFAADANLVTAEELLIPRIPSQFIVDISKQLARSEPQLTADFLNEFFVGWDSFPFHQRPLSLVYMAPWLPSLRSNVITSESDGERAREKISTIFRKLIDIATSDPSLGTTLEESVWPAICSDDLHTEIFMEEIFKSAMTLGVDDDRLDILGSIVASIGTAPLCGKVISKLRKAINRTSLRPTRYLPDNTVWSEICVLVRLSLSVSFDNGVQSQLFLPELFHIITMLANTGSPAAKNSIHRLLVNTIHSLCTSFTIEEHRLVRLKSILASLSQDQADISSPTAINKELGSKLRLQDQNTLLGSTDTLANLLSEISIIAAPTIDLSNAWRSRWMSLVASTAFQSNSAIQPRAFTVMGWLAREDVDDDLLYQVLVALRYSISHLLEDNDHEMLVAIVTSLTKMMEKLPTASRYGLQLFWLGISLVRLVPLGLFNCACLFLESVLLNINTSGELRNRRMVPILLQGRQPVEEAASQLDDSYGVHFNLENFHFAVCVSLAKGLSNVTTKQVTLKVLTAFMKIASSHPEGHTFPEDLTIMPYLSLIMSRALTRDEARDILWMVGIVHEERYGKNATPEDVLRSVDLDAIKDKELLLNAAVSIVDFQYLEDAVQNRALHWLNDVAVARPTVILHLCVPVFDIIDEVLLSCDNPTTLESAHKLLRVLMSNPQLSGRVDTAQILKEVLEDIGFGGIWRSSTFHAPTDSGRHRTILSDKLIELIIA